MKIFVLINIFNRIKLFLQNLFVTILKYWKKLVFCFAARQSQNPWIKQIIYH